MSLPPLEDWREDPKNRDYLDEFREHALVQEWLKDSHTDDYLIRWLIARNFNIEKSAKFFATSMAWREEYEVDTIIERIENEDFVIRLEKYWPCSQPGEFMTNDGSPIYFKRMCLVDPKSLDAIATSDELMLWHIYTQEKRERFRLKQYEELGYSGGGVWVSDTTGLGWKHLNKTTLGLYKLTKNIDAENYPESIRKMYIINTPAVFPVGFNLIKGSLDKGTLAKLSISKGNMFDEWKQIMPEEDIPNFCGGKLSGVSPGGGKLAEFEFEEESFFDDVEDPDLVNIPAGHSFEIPVKIKEPTTIGWKFEIETYDIEFYITYKKRSNGTEEKILSHEERIQRNEGSLEVKRGYYNLVFDNTYSWTRSKNLYYEAFMNRDDNSEVTED